MQNYFGWLILKVTYNFVRSPGNCFNTAARLWSVTSRHLADVPAQEQRWWHAVYCRLAEDFAENTSSSSSKIEDVTYMSCEKEEIRCYTVTQDGHSMIMKMKSC